MNQVNSAKNNLDGTRLLDQAKQTAKQQLNNMTHLTTAQKTNLTNQINSGTTVAGVQTVQSNANTLDQAMNTLRQSIANKDATKASEDYVDANNDKQTAYNNAVAAAETIINANSNPEMNPSTITQKAEQVNSSKTALNGDENLAAAKQNAKTYLNTLTSITDAQKNNLISQITSATRVSGVDTVKQNAQHLDQAMASLQNGINNESQVKSSEKYRDADTNKQQEYDNAITAAKAILNKSTGPNTAQNAVEAALQRVNNAKDALNGDAKLIAAQNAAKQHLGTLTHITTAQRNDLTNQISQATNLAGVESVKQNANSLDGAMGNLQTAINDKSGTLASQNFLDADEQKRNAYNQAVSAAETILNKQTGPNTAKTAVEQALNNVNNAKHALNGTQNLNNAKQAAITAINGASDLNQKQKDALKAQANGAQRVSNAQDVQHNATELNTAMGTLKHAIADKTNTLASSKYVNADSTKQNAYTTKVTNAEHIISGTPTVVTTPSEVTAAANQVNSAKQELNGDERLREAKQNANTAIDALTQLNTPQKAKLKEQVGQANRLEDVQTVQTNGQALNNAMKGLRDSIANETTVKTSQNYTDASPNNQSTYNSAVSNAKGIINQTNNPTMDTSAITQATTQVNNAKNGLNGAENLRNAQNTAKQNLNTLSHLTNNQKSAISSQIDRAGHVSEVTATKNAATELNTQMGNLEQAIHDQNTVKQSVKFTDADKAKRDAYTNAVSRAEAILNKTQGANTSKQDVEAAIQNVSSAKNALNGDQNVTNAKNAAKNALNNLTSINNAQKRDLTTKIDQATTVAGVEAVSNTSTQLNTAMANLQNGINDKTNTLASENYHDADSDKKTAYTQAVTNAENILNKNSGSNLDKTAVENALSQVANAKGALNGNHNLEQAKSNANTTINGLQHLTTAQKDKLKQQVQQAQNVAGVDTVKSSANTLNGAMGTLRNSIQDNTATKNGQNYLDATERNKTNYNNAVDSANGVINATSNPNMDANAINQIATQVTSTKNALDGTHNLTQAKQTATNAIDGATNLNKAQKDALKAQVTSAQRVANVTSIQQTANELNTAMGQLQHGIDDENATKQTQKYRDAEQSKKTAYDQAVAAAKAILNKQTGSNSDKAAVDRALQQVTSTKDALNGDAKLAEAKAAAKQNLGTLNHITNAQRTDLEGQINQATTVDGVNTVKTNANTLDGAMNSLQGSINDKDATLRNQNYLDADESKRNAYTQAVTAAEGILNKQTGGNTSKADVDNALNAVTRAKAALNGADNLRNAKTSATNTIDGLPNLTQLQKDNLKHQVEQAQNVAGVNGVKDKGNTLNTAMGALRTSIQNDNTTKTSQNYLDASDSNKNNYNTAVNNANGVINATNNPNMDANAINGMANQVNTTKAALNGAQNLAQAKTNATNTINNAHDLNQKQKDALKTQVNNAQRVSDANNVQHTATELNSAMTALKAAIADKERTKASGNYVNADQEKRQAYDSKVTNAENIISGTPNATLTVNDVNSAASQVNAAKTALNGDNNLRVAKEHANNTIDGLAQLNNAQKAKLKEQVQSATTLDGVQTVKNSSQTLNTAMKGLRDSIANEATIKAGQNYTDASPNNRNEYDSAVTAAKAIINQTSNPTMEPNTITQVTSQVTTKEQALNGARNLAQAKTTAKNNLNNLTSINNAQKDALTRSIDGATTVAGVNQETAKATELNNAMHSLQNGINDETQTKQTQKYLDAEPSKKSAYDQAVNAAKAILTKASGQNVDKAAVEQALQNVNSTKTALNGDAKLNEAKAAAKQTLGTLTHINNAQRTALDNEITQATNVEGVNTVKAKAQQLDGAMGQLETSIRDKDTTLQSQNYQDADDAKRTAYSQAVNAAATILNKTAGGNTPKADVERAMQAVTQANTALNGIQNLDRAKQAANTAITNASDLNTKQKEALKAQVTSAGRVSAANGVEHTATELNTAMTALKRAIADKAETKASGNYVNADANKRQAYDEKVTAAENIVSGTPTPTLTPADVTNAATQVTNAKTQLNGNHNLEVSKQNANTAIDGLTSLNGPQKAKLKEQVGQATTLPNVQTVRDNAQTLNTAMKGLRDSIANEATIKAGQNYTDASQNKQTDYNSAVTAAKAIIGQTTSPSMNAQEINQAKDQVTAKQQALNGQENLRTAQTNAKQHLNGLSDLTDAQKDAVKRQIEGATHVNEVTQAQNNADALNTAMTNLKNGIQDQNTIKQGVNFTDADEAKRNAYTNAVTQAEQILNKAQGPNTSKDGVETALENVQRAKNELNGNQNVANAKTTAKNALNNLTSINNAQKEALKSQIEGATTVAGVNQVSTTASELNTAMSNLQNGINDEAATKAAQKYTDADREKQTAYNDAVTAAKTLLDKTAGSNDNKAAVEQALQRVNTAKTALNGDERLNEAKNTAKQQVATMSHLTDAQKANLTSQIESGTTVAGVQGIQANAGTLDQAMNQLRQSIASKDATKSSEDYQDANADLQNAYNDAVTNAEGIISATNNPEMNPDTINQKASQVNSAKSALNGDEKLAAAKQTAKSDIGRLTDLNNAQRTAANAEVDQAPNLAAVTAAKNKATSLNTAMGNLKHALAEKDNTKRSVNYTDADQPKQQAYDTAVTQAEAITNANGSNANETQVQAALNQLNQAKNDLNGDNKVAQAKESAKRALASYSNLNNAQSTAATSQIDNATTVAGVTAAQNTANELNTAMGQLQNGINDQNTVKQQVNFTDADQGKKDAYTNAVTNAQGILDKAHGQNMTKAQVEAALNQVTTAKNALNGDANVRQAKSDAKANLGTLTHLNNAQKQDLTSQIEGATTVNGVNGVKTKAQDLDGAMQRLQSAIANKDQTKASENYIDADPTKKTAFDNAITQAESYLNKDHGANKDKQAVEQAIQSVTSTENALNGDANLQRAKTEAIQAIDNLTHLNTPQKTALKQQVNAAQRVSGVTDLKNSATSLNNAMDQLKQAIADHDTIVASGNYTNASPDKQGAYTDAYNAAKNIVNGSPNVITNAADVTAATQRVNNAETGLNGDTNLATAKQQAKDALRQMTHLSDAQKQSITGQIDSATQVTGVQSVKDNATNLDNAMNQLRNSIANKDDVKASQPYVDADRDKQNAYNTAVTNAENIINATSQPTLDPSAVTQAANQVSTNKTALNGAQNLANKKQETTANINQLSHLNNAQKQDLNTQVTNAPNISTVNQVKTKAEQLDQAMERLINGIQDKDQVKQSVNFTDADPEKQTAYNNAVTAAENIINQANGTNANQSQVEAALSTVTTTKQALNGDRKVTDAKNNANQTLSTLDNLNNAQKGAVTGNINQAHTVAEVTQAIQTAQELNTAMGNLKNSLNDKDTTLGSQNFADADPEKKNAQNLNTAMGNLKQAIADKDATKATVNFTDADQAKQQAYNTAVTNAENIISKANGGNATQAEVEQAIKQVNAAKQALNGNANVQHAKDEATALINSSNDLNQAQKDALKQQVQNATTVAGVNNVKQTAQELNNAMTQLKQGIADKEQTKADGNFVNADPDKQNAYNNAVAHAEQIISGTPNANVDPQQVAQALQQVNQAKGDLNGNHNLQVAKDNANTAIDQLPNLNQPQKTALKDQVSHAELVTGVNAIKQNADALNNAMGTLKQQIQANSQVPQSVDFTQADQDKQQAYNNAANQAQQIANGIPTPVLTPDTVTQAVTTMNQAKDALNGDEKLAQAKQEALANLDTLRDLNQPQRDALRNQINQAQALATVEQTKQNAQNVNTAMSNLKQGIANKDTVKASENYHDADADKQTAYTNAVSQAEGIINQTTNPTLNPDEITRALTQVTDAKNGLNGEAKLATEKQNAKDAVSGMTHLNDAQKQALKGQIDQSPEIATVNQVKQTATSLDQAMDQLSQAINDKAQTLADGNYLNADPDKQNAYKQAVAKAEALLNKQSGTNEVQAQVESITNEVNAAKQALNGNDNLANAKQQAKQQLANLTHLNDAQKQSFESQITQAPLVTDVTTINQKAQTLDHAMELLRNSVADNQTTLASEDYHDATAQRQNDYNQAVTAANNIINQTTSPTMNPDDVNGATTQVNNTKVALDGDENLAAAKQQANNRLDQLDHLNNAQKQQLQSQITQSSDIAAVNGHKQTAESLNTAMGNLINAIADHQAVEQRGNFINADTDKQTAYNTAVNEAAAMINKQTGQNANQTEVEQAITKVQTTLQALNGDHNLQVAKTNATQAIDALTSLNDPQKTALKDQVTAATLVTAVHQIEQNANTLNQAMHGLRQSIQDNAATKANSKYINEDQPEQQNYDQAVQAANNIINEQTATLDNNAINQAATTVNTTKAALHGDVKLQNDKDHAKQTVSQLAHLNNAQKHMEDTLIDSETTRTAVKQDLTEAQALDQLMDALQQSIADKDATRASSAYVNAEPNKKQSYDEAVQNAESIIAGLNNPTINKGNVSSATQAVISSKNALDGVERLAQDKQTAGNSLNHLDQLTPAQQQALENQINNATTRGEVAQKLTEAQALNQAMEALRNSIQDQQQTEAGSKFINEDKPQKDAYQAAVQNAKDLINQTNNPTLDKAQVEQLTQAVNQAKDNLHGDQKLADDKQHAVTDLNQLNGLNNPQRQALESQINNAATRGEVAQKLAEAKALDQAMQALRNSIQDQQQTESGSKFINEDKPQKDAYQAAVQNAKDLINQTGNPTLDKSQVEQLTQAVTTAKDNLHGDQKLARDQQQAVTTVNALPNLNHAQQQALTDAINAAPTRTEVAQHVQTATELDHAMETLKNKVDQVNTDKAQPNYTEASTDKKEAVDQALQAAESITDPTNGSNANKDAVDQVLTKLQEKENELNGNERVAEAKTQAKQTIDQLTHLNADQIATAKQNIDQATKLQPIAELVDQATQLNQSMDQLQQAVNEHANVEQTVDYTQADSDKQNAYKQAIADAENVLKQNANKQQVDQALQNILNAKQALNGDERVALAKTNGKHDIDQLNALNNAQQDGFKGRIDQSNDLNQIQQIVDEAKALNRAMDQLSQEITDNEGRTKGSTNYVNADTQVKQVYDETVDKAKQALDKSTGQNLTAKQVIKLNDAVTAAKKALNGEERLNNRKAEALQRLDQLTHLNNAQRQLAIQQINNAETLNKASRAINRATKLDNAMGAVQQYIDEQHLGVISSTNYINADDNLKANYDNAIANAAHELDKVQGNAIAKAEAEQLKQNIIDAQNALNGDQNLANAKDKANAFVNSLNGLNQQQQDLAHKAINNADTVSDVTDIVNNQIDLNDAMETLKHLVDNEIPNAEQTVNYQNADDNAKTNFDDAKRLANTLLNSDNTNVNDINGAIQAVNDAIHNLNGDQRLQDAKDKAIQSINQALANKLKEIEASNATDQDKLIAKNKAEELANSIINNINKATSNQAVSQVQTAGNHAIEQVHANEIPKAKIDANKDVDKQVQALIDEIDRNPNLTDKEKQALKDRINQILQQGHNGINNAMTKEEIEQAKAQLAQALQDIKDLVKAKEDAKQDVDKQVQALIDEIDQNPNLTDKEKQALKDRINQILQQGHNDINNAMTKEAIEQAKERLAQALQDIKDLVKAKEDAKNDIDKRVQALIDEIDQNPNLTDKEKQALKDRINQILQQGHNDINNALTKEEIEQAKAQLAQALQDIKDLVKAKEDAKNAIKALANAKRDQINSNPDLTPEQKAKALKEIDEAEKRALQNVENAQTIDQLNRGLNLGLDDIRNTHVWEVDEQPAVNEIFEATPEQILVNGELIVHRDDIITEQDILAHINLIDQLSAEVIDTPSTATISDSLTAKVEVTLLDGSKVIVNVPVKVVEKELSVVKQQAIESIENAAQQKINEINNSVTLTLEQKEAAIAEVNKLKQQAIDHVNNAPDVHSVEEIQQQEQAHIEQFNPEQFTIEQAKSNAIKSIEDAIQHMIDEIKARTDLTDKEKQEAIAKLNQLKEQAIQAIQRAQSIDEISEQLEQFKAQMKAANPTAKELAKRKQEAISRIKDFSNEKINSIRNSEIGTADEKQAAMNQINEIVLETIRDINNAHTLQQVEAALNNGIARISAVQIVTSDRAKQSSSTGNESNSHLTIGYGTANHPFNSSTIGHKKKLDEDDDIDPLHMRHFSNNFGNVIKNAIGVVGISGLLASFWFFIAKRRRKEDEEEELEIRDNNKDSIKETLDDTKHLPLLFAKRRRKEDEEDVTVEEKDSLNNGESLDKVKHTPFFLPKRRRKEDEEDVEVTNENTDEKVLKDNEHSPLLFAKRRKDKEEDVETTTSIESKDEDVPLLLAKKKNQKDNQSKDKKSASKNTSKKVAAKKKKKKAKKNKK
ncbi:cell wall associated fibronectin-binding protein [Staphylococcus aureus]|nr:cell wall associated fibronectin-binding protein [Staphylococcus aureus]CUE09125.1 cell wall associated fibronectin-binding protein [Staphylococcus aureus]